MNAITKISASDRYARCVQASKRVRWEIEQDIIRGRRFDTGAPSIAAPASTSSSRRIDRWQCDSSSQ